jgi:hypothetical protein
VEVGDGQTVPKSSVKIGDFDHRRQLQINVRLGGVEFGRKVAFLVANRRDAGHDFDGMMSPVGVGITRVAVDLGRGRLAFALD